MAQIHVDLDDRTHRQLKLLAIAKGVTFSSLARSYVTKGVDEELAKKDQPSGKSLEPSLLLQEKQNRQLTILPKNKAYCQTTNDVEPQTHTQHPKPKSSELDEWHRLFFAECFLAVREPLIYDSTGFAIYEPFSLMALADKGKLIEFMLKRDEKKFRVYEPMAHHIVDKMIRLKVIATTSIISGDFLACPLLLLDCIVKRAAKSSSSCSENDVHDCQLQIPRTATMAAAKIEDTYIRDNVCGVDIIDSEYDSIVKAESRQFVIAEEDN